MNCIQGSFRQLSICQMSGAPPKTMFCSIFLGSLSLGFAAVTFLCLTHSTESFASVSSNIMGARRLPLTIFSDHQKLETLTVHLDVESIRVECTENALPFGFAVSSRQGTTVSTRKIQVGSSRRSYYRLAHLDETTRQQIWHARGLVHALLTIYTEQTQVHLRPGFRQINGWDTQGTLNKNDDSWGYSRALDGERKIRLHYLGEEWFVRPPDRKRKPDNRVECQSFQKGRVFQKLFEPEAVDLPPYCESFRHGVAHWGLSTSFIPARGMARFLARSPSAAYEPVGDHTEPLDQVYQFVGLVNLNTRRPSHSMWCGVMCPSYCRLSHGRPSNGKIESMRTGRFGSFVEAFLESAHMATRSDLGQISSMASSLSFY